MTEEGAFAPLADCHVHLFDPARFPYRCPAELLPEARDTATVEQLLAVLDAHYVDRAVVVTPTTGYSENDLTTRHGMQYAPDRIKGIASLQRTAGQQYFREVADQGFAGVRIDLTHLGVDYLQTEGCTVIDGIFEHDLIAQVQLDADMLIAVESQFDRNDGRIVIDHVGRPDPTLGLDQPGFAALIRLAKRESVFIKLSGAFRFSKAGFPYYDTDPYVHRVLETFGPERCLFGSDWPFIRTDHRIDYGPVFDVFNRWVEDDADRRTILSTTPIRLFGFSSRP